MNFHGVNSNFAGYSPIQISQTGSNVGLQVSIDENIEKNIDVLQKLEELIRELETYFSCLGVNKSSDELKRCTSLLDQFANLLNDYQVNEVVGQAYHYNCLHEAIKAVFIDLQTKLLNFPETTNFDKLNETMINIQFYNTKAKTRISTPHTHANPFNFNVYDSIPAPCYEWILIKTEIAKTIIQVKNGLVAENVSLRALETILQSNKEIQKTISSAYSNTLMDSNFFKKIKSDLNSINRSIAQVLNVYSSHYPATQMMDIGVKINYLENVLISPAHSENVTPQHLSFSVKSHPQVFKGFLPRNLHYHLLRNKVRKLIQIKSHRLLM